MNGNTVQTASQYIDLGFEILPVRLDGSKAPAAPTWSGEAPGEFEPEDVEGKGIGIKCGALSNNLVVFDFESVEAFRDFGELVKKADLGYVLETAAVATSPRPGRHLYLHLDERPTGSFVCAQTAEGKTLIEIRARGSYVVAPGSPDSCHKSGRPYRWRREPVEDRRYLSAAEYEALISIAESLDKSGMHTKPEPERRPMNPIPEGRNQPGDDYNRRGDIGEVLGKHGFRLLTTKRDGTELWQKPNSSDERQHQLTRNSPGCPDRLYCFSSSCSPFRQGISYDNFSIYALLEHAGDYSAAAKQLGKEGFGEKTKPAAVPVAPQTAEEPTRIWMEPVLFDQVSAPPDIPTAQFPEPMAGYLRSVAESIQVPEAMVTMLALSVIATCAQRRFEVAVGGDHVEPLSIWTLVALPPSTRKTAVFQELTRPLDEWEKTKSEEMRSAIYEHEINQEVARQKIADLQRLAAKKETDKYEKEMLVQEAAVLKEKLAVTLHSPRLWTGDTTPERLQGLLTDHGERMSVLTDEGGIFEVMSGMYSDGKANVDVFLKSHAGSPVRVDRAGRTVHLQRPALTFGLTVQPSIVSDLGSGDKRRFRGNGLLARFLYCIPASNVGSRDVRSHKAVSTELRLRYHALIRELLSVEPRLDSSGTETPRMIHIGSEAIELWYQFSDDIEKKQAQGKEFERIQDWTGKLPGAVARIAGLLHLVKAGSDAEDSAIDPGTMTSAIEIGRRLIMHAQVAFDSMMLGRAVSDAKCLYQWILERKVPSLWEPQAYFRQSEPYRIPRFKENGRERLLQAIDELVARNIISSQEKMPTKKPTLIYAINPSVIPHTVARASPPS